MGTAPDINRSCAVVKKGVRFVAALAFVDPGTTRDSWDACDLFSL